MSYVLPQTLVFQEINDVTQATLRQQPAHLAGGHAWLVRHSVAAEKPTGLLGNYDSADNLCFSWPSLPVGAIIDQTYTKVFVDNALLQYFNDDLSSGSVISSVANYPNRIRSNTVAFKANGTTYPRNSQLYDRDVQVGDIAKVRAVVGANTYILWTYVAGFVGEVVPSITGAATSDANNAAANASTTVSVLKTAGPHNCVDPSATATAYKGLPSGYINEVYTITVTSSSSGGKLNTGVIRVTSASGADNQASVIPNAAGTPTPIGTRGLTVTFNFDHTAACSLSATGASVSPEDLIVGQTWQVTVHQQFTPPTPTSGGTYVGTSSCNYIITVTRGGLFTDVNQPQITITTDNGSDQSGPTTVTAAATAVPVGTNGVNVKFSQIGLRKGDKYYIAATAQGVGAYQTLVLANNLNTAIPAGTQVGLTLFINKDLSIPADRVTAPPNLNWTQSATQFCMNSGLTVYDPSWTNLGVQMALPVVSDAGATQYSKLYLEYRAWRQDLVGKVTTIQDSTSAPLLIPGDIGPDNPLLCAALKALLNSNGCPVQVTAISDPSVPANWSLALEAIDGRTDVYGLVPLTQDVNVFNLYAAHINAQSAPEYGNFRVGWFNLQDVPLKSIVTSATSTDGNVVLATISADPNTSGNPITIVAVPAGNAQFIKNGVLAGDMLRAYYTTDGFGNTTYQSFPIASVTTQDQLVLATAAPSQVTQAAKIEIWRTLSADDESVAIGAAAGVFANRRIMAVWPDTVSSAGTSMPGYHVCAALAGLASGVAPHQGLTNLALQGFDDISRSYKKFNRTQLNNMAGAGTLIVTQDPVTGVVFSRHALTSATPDGNINDREEMIVRNLDSVSFIVHDQYNPYIGIANVTPSMINVIKATAESVIGLLTGNAFIARLGPQVISASVVEARAHAYLRDRVVLTMNFNLPYALNNLEAHIVI